MSTIYCAAARTQLSPLPINTFSASLPARKWRECSRRSHCRFSIILFLQVGASESPELNGTTVPFSALEVPDYQGPNRDPPGYFVPFCSIQRIEPRMDTRKHEWGTIEKAKRYGAKNFSSLIGVRNSGLCLR